MTKFRVGAITGFAVGFYIGAMAGRKRFDQINRLIGKVQRAGYTLTPLNLHFSKGRIKLEIGLARGKKQYDKRETEKLRDWTREKQRLLRNRSGAPRASRSG